MIGHLNGADDERPRHLLNEDGSCFEDLRVVELLLSSMAQDKRYAYRDANAAAIAATAAERLLVVAGPGAGKTYLFLARINHWLAQGDTGSIYVTTFVRKLVNDLRSAVRTKRPDDKNRIEVSTLHTLARSLLERCQGTAAFPMRRFIRIVDRSWAETVWDDVVQFDPGNLSLLDGRDLDEQFHTATPDPDPVWVRARDVYRRLCQFYNAVGFAYLIAFAYEAIDEQPQVIEHDLWIIDEYQDFNAAEDRLIGALARKARGVLLAGDDDQALYQELKSATPDIITGHYRRPTLAKAMLPFCSRCGYHICLAASAFIARHRGTGAIDKVYLPLDVTPDSPKVQVVATATPGTAVDYIRTFLKHHAEDLETYLRDRELGKDTDPFLLIVGPTAGLTLSRSDKAERELREMVDSFAIPTSSRSNDYRRVVAYATADRHPDDNFSVRKVLAYENVSIDEVHLMIVDAMQRSVPLADVVAERQSPVLDRARKVREAVDLAASDPVAAATAISGIFRITGVDALATELAEFPIGQDARDTEDTEAVETAGEVAPVALMTMVGSKGLSAHHVIVLGCDDQNMSNTSALTFFVAITRARKTLHLIASAKAGGSRAPHRFVFDLPAACCDYIVYKKTGHVAERLPDVNAFRSRFEQWERVAAKARTRGRG